MTGFICFDKPKNITSFSAVGILKRLTHEKKAGHAGTLDPMATGVLPVALGGATRFIELFDTHDKAYEAKIRLGMTTDTLDITGNVLSQCSEHTTEAELLRALDSFKGKIKQLPPMYSAIKKDGVRLYELARKGIETEREEREVTIHSIECIDFDELNREFTLSVECSQGTYIRSLSNDIGQLLGCGAVMTELRRTKALGFTAADCVSEDEVKKLAAENRVDEVIISVDKALRYDSVTVSEKQAVRFSNGGCLSTERLTKKLLTDSYYKVYSPSKEFLGVGEVTSDGAQLNVKRVFMGDSAK